MADFTKCIGPQGTGLVCQLDAGTYTISSILLIGRSNITIEGASASTPAATVLQGAPDFTSGILSDSYTGSLTSITFRYLTFDGNRQGQTKAYTDFNQGELSVSSTKSVLVASTRFVNSPFIGFTIFGGCAQGIVMNNSYFGDEMIYGLWSDSLQPSTYLTCSNNQFADNVVVSNAQFEDIGEPAIFMNATNIQLTNSIFHPGSRQLDYRI